MALVRSGGVRCGQRTAAWAGRRRLRILATHEPRSSSAMAGLLTATSRASSSAEPSAGTSNPLPRTDPRRIRQGPPGPPRGMIRRRPCTNGCGYTAVARAAGDMAGHGECLRGGLSSTAEHRIVAPKVTGSKPVGHPNSLLRHGRRSRPARARGPSRRALHAHTRNFRRTVAVRSGRRRIPRRSHTVGSSRGGRRTKEHA